MLPPVQKEDGPSMVGIGGLDASFTVTMALVAVQLPEVTETE